MPRCAASSPRQGVVSLMAGHGSTAAHGPGECAELSKTLRLPGGFLLQINIRPDKAAGEARSPAEQDSVHSVLFKRACRRAGGLPHQVDFVHHVLLWRPFRNWNRKEIVGVALHLINRTMPVANSPLLSWTGTRRWESGRSLLTSREYCRGPVSGRSSLHPCRTHIATLQHCGFRSMASRGNAEDDLDIGV